MSDYFAGSNTVQFHGRAGWAGIPLGTEAKARRVAIEGTLLKCVTCEMETVEKTLQT